MTDTDESQDWGNEMDRPEHEKTYEAFLGYSKWSLIIIAFILIGLLLFVYGG
ncbi:MAG: aa3-type cytochrome c oxidase subunit IV [Parvibaculales bacterium]|nr:aa3-type cytochrome c oxidase subunit IV [Alphaproteobacteria bacterium]